MAKKTAVEQRLDDLSESLDKWGDRLEKALDKHATDDKETFEKHDGRISSVEQRLAKYAGVAIALSMIFSAVAAAAAKHYFP
jgi:hypothetical protein